MTTIAEQEEIELDGMTDDTLLREQLDDNEFGAGFSDEDDTPVAEEAEQADAEAPDEQQEEDAGFAQEDDADAPEETEEEGEPAAEEPLKEDDEGQEVDTAMSDLLKRASELSDSSNAQEAEPEKAEPEKAETVKKEEEKPVSDSTFDGIPEEALNATIDVDGEQMTMREYMEEFPDVVAPAKMLFEQANKRVSAIEQSNQRLMQDVAQDRYENALFRMHPDFVQVTRSSDFAEWLTAQPESVRVHMMNSMDPADGDYVLKAFKEHKGAAKKEPEPKQQAKRAIRSSTLTSNKTSRSARKEQDDFARGFESDLDD